MTKDEALRLALEALENSDDLVRENAYSAEQLYGNYPARQGKVRGLKALVEDHEKAITAIKAALEAKDEPVEQPEVRTGNCLRVGVCASEGHKIQPQRTWIGLTAEERQQVQAESYGKVPHHVSLIAAVEAKLKEKNT